MIEEERPEVEFKPPIVEGPHFTVTAGAKRFTEKRRVRMRRETASHLIRLIAHDSDGGIYATLREQYGVEMITCQAESTGLSQSAFLDYNVEIVCRNPVLAELAVNDLETYLITVARTT